LPLFLGDAPEISYIIVISPIKRWNIQTTGKKEGRFVLAFQFVRPSNSDQIVIKVKEREREREEE